MKGFTTLPRTAPIVVIFCNILVVQKVIHPYCIKGTLLPKDKQTVFLLLLLGKQ